MNLKTFILVTLVILLSMSCGRKEELQMVMDIQSLAYGKTEDGKQVDKYVLKNTKGMEVSIITYGAIIQSLLVPDRDGKIEDVTLGYDRLEDYIKDSPYFGAIVGRYGNRIEKGKFSLDGTEYSLATNNGENHLHGGIQGFDKVVWKAEALKKEGALGLKLNHVSLDGEEGYPGNLDLTVTYWLNNENEILIEYLATTDKATPCNITHHSYFNLTGGVKNSILGHELWINADKMTPVDVGLIPTGVLDDVVDSPFDFTTATKVGARIDQENQQLTYGGGYDHNWCLNDVDGSLKLQASLYDETSGRYMEILTQEPGLQFYSGNFLDGSNVGKAGKVYAHRNGLCLETQHFPDSPNQPTFPSTTLKPGDRYETKTVYKFSTK
ncbi:MAG: galactose mutarotase [Candidatus Marinimicrobia bacterium]|jgi:aldose 1-epimerase|nr:galactose mutarotase [Candidatus Neomarinimicrobiota bacterium]MBT4361239.1 galactose mutarotase [Candidatus Neomarinimicrobiota bacterium]MBT4715176.1 galactose mutarotase [Candidatus Neomarinimicrobiota bacterium]MBT4947350.1 galactose mutarotase [Candidatus Neomarinimicrobiota bacterium]MBT5271461.1 galactose mutarotase [Candidatus Neomarinimicrobiota bacterium]